MHKFVRSFNVKGPPDGDGGEWGSRNREGSLKRGPGRKKGVTSEKEPAKELRRIGPGEKPI